MLVKELVAQLMEHNQDAQIVSWTTNDTGDTASDAGHAVIKGVMSWEGVAENDPMEEQVHIHVMI